jgi:putative transposase
MCKVLKVSKSGYYKWIKSEPSKRTLYNKQLTLEIKQIFEAKKGRYGSPRITKELKEQGKKVSEPLVAKLMKKAEIRSFTKKKFKSTTNSSHNYPVAENILNRQFNPQIKSCAWVSDITYIHTKQGWVYLTTVIDLWDRKVIGWSLNDNMTAKDTSVAAFKMALTNRPLGVSDTLIFHSDRGIQYACEEFVSTIVNTQKNITRSMSRKGNCWDNAVAESFFKTLKVELVYQNKYITKSEAILSVFEYIETFYNTNRRHAQLNNLTIIEFYNLFNNNFKKVA